MCLCEQCGQRETKGLPYGFVRTKRRRLHVIVGVGALDDPCDAMEFVRTKRRLASPLPLRVIIPSGATKRSRGISTEARKPRARYEHAKLFLAKMLLRDIGLQRFYLDPATASPCGLLARQSLASQTSTPLRCAQDDAAGMKSRISGERSSPLRGCVRIWTGSRIAGPRRSGGGLLPPFIHRGCYGFVCSSVVKQVGARFAPVAMGELRCFSFIFYKNYQTGLTFQRNSVILTLKQFAIRVTDGQR